MSDIEAVLHLKHGQACKFLQVRIGPHGLNRFLAICIDDRQVIRDDLPMLRQACSLLMEFRSLWVRPMHSSD